MWRTAGLKHVGHVADSYSFHCGMAAMLFAKLDIRHNDCDFETARWMIEVWCSAANLLLSGDYYAHMPFHKDAGQRVVWQFNRPEAGCG